MRTRLDKLTVSTVFCYYWQRVGDALRLRLWLWMCVTSTLQQTFITKLLAEPGFLIRTRFMDGNRTITGPAIPQVGEVP